LLFLKFDDKICSSKNNMKTNEKNTQAESSLDRIERAFFAQGSTLPGIKKPLKPTREKPGKLHTAHRATQKNTLQVPQDNVTLVVSLVSAVVMLLLTLGILFLHGSLYIIPRISTPLQSTPVEVTNYSFAPEGTNMRETPRRIMVTLPSFGSATLTVELKTRLNLEQHRLWIPLSSIAAGITGSLFVKDMHFHSSTFTPVPFAVQRQGASPAGVLLDLSEVLTDSAVDLKKVTQLKIVFDNPGTKTAVMVLDKNIALIKK